MKMSGLWMVQKMLPQKLVQNWLKKPGTNCCWKRSKMTWLLKPRSEVDMAVTMLPWKGLRSEVDPKMSDLWMVQKDDPKWLKLTVILLSIHLYINRQSSFKVMLFLQILLPFIVVFRQVNIPHDEKVSSHNKAMDRGLKPAIAKPGRTNNTYIVIIVSFFSV